MHFKKTFQQAWESGQGHDALLKMVRTHQDLGLPSQEAYEILQQIWIEFGYDDVLEPTPLQDSLEYVMEKTWYECPPLAQNPTGGNR